MIDILSDTGIAPIIVGDVDDMADIRGVTPGANGQYHLDLNGQMIALSPPASDNFRKAAHLLLVNVEGMKVVGGRKVKIADLADGHDLSADQCSALEKALTLTDNGSREFFTASLSEFRQAHPELVAA